MESEKFQQEQQPVEQSEEKKALAECHAQLAEWKDKFIRLSADFQNFKKRLHKEQASLTRMMQADVLLDVIIILDNVERALQERPENLSPEVRGWADGFELIRKEFYKVLEKYGVKEIEFFDEFNPELHEAVMHVESDLQPGSIVEVVQKGYMMGDFVLRPAKVSIAQGK